MTNGASDVAKPGLEPAPAPPSEGFAARLRGFGPIGIAAIVIVGLAGVVVVGRVAIPLGGLLVLAWARWSGTPWRAIGYVRPKSWIAELVLGIAFGVALKLLTKALVMPLLGAPAINDAFHDLAGNRALLAAAAWMMIAAGFGEETAFRGFLFERLGKLLGSRPGAKAWIVVVSSALFAAAHYGGQGLPGVEQAAITGLSFGTIYALTGRLWMPMCAHAAYDLTALAIIYWDVESDVAHWILA